MSTKKVRFVSPDVMVKYSDLLKPDVYKNSASHKVQVLINDEFMTLLQEKADEVGATKINGLRETDEGTVGSFKCRLYTKDGIDTFPEVYDSQGQKTKTVPFGGATVRLALSSYVLDDNTVSFMLNKIQVIDLGRDEASLGGGFDAVEGGFVTSNVVTETTEEVPAGTPASDDIPF